MPSESIYWSKAKEWLGIIIVFVVIYVLFVLIMGGGSGGGNTNKSNGANYETQKEYDQRIQDEEYDSRQDSYRGF